MFYYYVIPITLLICQFVQLSGIGSVDANNFSSSSTVSAAKVATMDDRDKPRITSLQEQPYLKMVNDSESPVSNSSIPTTATKYHATLGSTVTFMPRITSSNLTAEKLALERRDRNRSFGLTTRKKLEKRVFDQMGYAFFFDDDDDDEDDWNDGYDQEIYNKHEKIANNKPEQNVDVHSESEESELESEPQEVELESETETKPSIILRTRRKNTKRKRGKHGLIRKHHFKKWKKFMLPLLIAYKLKFFTLVPLLFGILKLILATTSFAGFFFALFAISLSMKNRQQHQYPGA